MNRLFASVVVPTRNRVGYLSRLLAALEAQEYGGYEVIVVDDASTDGTPEFLQAWEREGRVALRQEIAAGSYAARNRGWRAARGSIVAFTDDDCVPQPQWLAELVWAIEADSSGQIVGAQGVTLAVGGKVTPFTHQIDQERPGPPYRTCNIAYRREVLERLGGFDDRLPWYADNILGLRMREIGLIAFAPRAVVHHPPRPREWRDRSTWMARFHADALHREVLYEHTREPRVPASALPVILWVLRPLMKQSLVHLRYLMRHPAEYAWQMRPMVREKSAMLLAMRDYRREIRMQPDRSEPLSRLPEEPLVSVVVVTRDRPRLLEGLLGCLQQQTWEKYEVVVVEHGKVSGMSGDRLASGSWGGGEAGTAGAGPYDGHGSLAAARQAGVEASKGEIIAFTDDDCLPGAGWLAAIVATFRLQPELWGVQGRTNGEAGPVGAHVVRVQAPNPLYQTCNIAYRREAVGRAGGFDERFDGWFEDTALGARILRHGPIGFASDAVVMHRAMPRVPKDRAIWRRILRDERLLADEYPEFYRRTRGRSFLIGVMKHWLVGSPVKIMLLELPRAGGDVRSYLRLIWKLLWERVALVQVLLEDRK